MAAALAVLLPACSRTSDTTEPPPPPQPPVEERTLPDTIALQPFIDSLVALMPGRDSNGYEAPDPDERIAMRNILADARAGRVARADSVADAFRYDVEATVDAVHGDSLIVMVERTPILRGWGTYVLRRAGVAADVHIDHPVFDVNTPRIGTALFDACRCRALLVAGTHRYANPDDVSDMARSPTSILQLYHEALAEDARIVVSVHGFARTNYDDPIGSSDAVLSLGADEDDELHADAGSRTLRDALRDAGFVAGLIADDPGYDRLTASSNPQGRYSNERFGHGRWLHLELAREIRDQSAAWHGVAAVVAEWIAAVVNPE